MNIDEIYAEIPKAFPESFYDCLVWIRKNVNEDYPSTNLPEIDKQTVARILVDWAYEAGQNCGANYDRGVKYGYEKGFEAGKAETLKSDKMPGDVWIEDTPLYQAGYETAAKDPTAWYILDQKGNQLHIGDTVIWDWSSEPFECTGFYAIGDHFRVLRGWDGYDPDEIQKCEKVTSDPWEDLENELAARLYEIDDLPAPFDIARQFIDRAKKLAGVDQ